MIRLIIKIISWTSKIVGYLYKYRTVYMVTGFFATRKFKPAKVNHSYAILIAARNEESVIGNLIESIRRQDYPGHVEIFVVADNCTDDTARIAGEGGAIVYERFDTEHRTKGYALQFLVECIRRDFGIDSYEGYFIFDADNLLKSDYISRMNDAFDAGEKIVTSYRNTKNFGDNWISASYGIHWLRTIRNEHRARSLFRLATRIQGTGFLFASEVIREDGWKYVSLTEDRAFCADAVVNGYRISYQNDAEFYDEQPIDIKVAMRQRIRWAKGHLQAFVETGGKLFLNIFKRPFNAHNFMSFDMLTVVYPRSIVSLFRKLIVFLLRLSLLIGAGFAWGPFWALVWGTLYWTVYAWGKNMLNALYVFVIEYRRIAPIRWYKKLWYIFMFPTFDLIGKLSMVIALFSKVEWKPIEHKVATRIDEIEKERNTKDEKLYR